MQGPAGYAPYPPYQPQPSYAYPYPPYPPAAAPPRAAETFLGVPAELIKDNSGLVFRIIAGLGLGQFIAIIIFGTTFYNQVSNNQTNNEKRFQEFADQRKIYNDQMTKMQESQTGLTITTNGISKDIITQGLQVKEIIDTLHAQDMRNKSK